LLDAPAFAFEFLRRNPEFLKDHTRLARKTRGSPISPGDTEAKAFAERWGVRFRKRLARSPGRRHALDGKVSRCCGCPDKGSRRPDQS
jgi:hypothetical protein